MSKVFSIIVTLIFLLSFEQPSFAQVSNQTTQEAQVTPTPLPRSPIFPRENQNDISSILANRDVSRLTPINFMAYALQAAHESGVPIDSIIVALTIPVIATLVVLFRYILGFPTLGIASTVVFSITFVVTGLTLGTVLLASVLLGTFLSRIIFRKVRIMQFTKVALSMLVIIVCILAALVLGLRYGIITSTQISILPVLLFILLSERIVALQLVKHVPEALGIIITTVALGAVGYVLISVPLMRNILLLYPELLLLLIPINWMIGRYYGLRLTEYFRFIPNIRHVTQ